MFEVYLLHLLYMNKLDFSNEDKIVLLFQSHIEISPEGFPVAHVEGGKITLIAPHQYKASAEINCSEYKEEVMPCINSALKFVATYCNKEE